MFARPYALVLTTLPPCTTASERLGMCCFRISASMYSSTLSACARASTADAKVADSSRQNSGENGRVRWPERLRAGCDIGAPEQGGQTAPAIGANRPHEGLNAQTQRLAAMGSR